MKPPSVGARGNITELGVQHLLPLGCAALALEGHDERGRGDLYEWVKLKIKCKSWVIYWLAGYVVRLGKVGEREKISSRRAGIDVCVRYGVSE